MITKLVRQVRRNHGLEHAAVAVLMERGVRPPMGGYSFPGGFFVLSKASTEIVSEAAHEALERLRAEEPELAVSPFCGTNLATGALLAAALSALVLGRKEGRLRRIPTAAGAILGAMLVSRPLGNALQRHYTTLADVSGLEITGVKNLLGSLTGRFTVHKVRTRSSDPDPLIP